MILLLVTAEQPTASAGHSATSQQSHSDATGSYGTKHGKSSFVDGIVKCILDPVLKKPVQQFLVQ